MHGYASNQWDINYYHWDGFPPIAIDQTFLYIQDEHVHKCTLYPGRRWVLPNFSINII